MKNKICTISYTPLGQTFLSWSLYFLHGETEYLKINDKQVNYHKLPDSPISGINAHGYKKGYIVGSNGLLKSLDIINSQPNQSRIYSVQPIGLRMSTVAKLLYNKPADSEVLTPEELKNILDFTYEDVNKIPKICCEQNVNLIYMVDNNIHNYYYRPRTILKNLKTDKHPDTILDTLIERVKWNFPGLDKKFNNFSTIWDLREGLAMGMDATSTQTPGMDYKLPHYYLEATSLWFDGCYTLKNIMNYCGLTIDNDRWDTWKNIYYEWQETAHLKRLRLTRNIDHVCKSILNSWNHDLTQYNLDIIDEAFIQHILIYKYDTTIKGYNLDRFPKNTRDFHNLIEPSFYEELVTRK